MVTFCQAYGNVESLGASSALSARNPPQKGFKGAARQRQTEGESETEIEREGEKEGEGG